jgi:5'-nucleotidase
MALPAPLILLTNDDGIHAEGLRRLRRAVEDLGEIVVSAPESQQSAVGHAITLNDPIRVREVRRHGEFYGYGVAGTPADSVKLAIHSLVPRPPSLVISGINDGANVGVNVLYSGTVSAATEAAILGYPAIACSLAEKKRPMFEWAVPWIRAVAKLVMRRSLPRGVALNVNVPSLAPEKIKGFKLTRQSLEKFTESYEPREDPRGNVYYWLSGEVAVNEEDATSDVTALRNGFVSVTPLYYDLTAHSSAPELARFLEDL